MFQHIPVLLAAVLEGLKPGQGRRYIDGTLGGGGHSAALLEQAGAGAELLGIDADPAALAAARQRLELLPAREPPQRIVLVQGNFRELARLAAEAALTEVDGILLDLGVSSHQLDTPQRGFSFAVEAALDMRLDPGSDTTAADLINRLDEQDLADIFYYYGEERGARRIARWIVERRRTQPLTTTTELAELIARALGGKRGRIHPATRSFQALRIAVNQELSSLEAALPQAVELLRPGGRLAVISFHSLEDRIVKQFFRAESGYGGAQAAERPVRLRIITKKPIEASDDEVAANPRSRSAKLRIAEREG